MEGFRFESGEQIRLVENRLDTAPSIEPMHDPRSKKLTLYKNCTLHRSITSYIIHSSGKTIESEDKDRADLSLPGYQLELLQDAVSVGKPTILVLYNAGPVDISWAKENVDVIMLNFLPGQSAGKALLAVLMGKANPAGRLPYTWPVNMDQVDEYDFYCWLCLL